MDARSPIKIFLISIKYKFQLKFSYSRSEIEFSKVYLRLLLHIRYSNVHSRHIPKPLKRNKYFHRVRVNFVK